MNPRDRKLRLRKTTVLGLTGADSSLVQGGVLITGTCENCSWLVIICVDQPPDPETVVFSNCPACPPKPKLTDSCLCPTRVSCEGTCNPLLCV